MEAAGGAAGRGRMPLSGMSDADDRPVVLYDGLCNLCSAAVDFILRHDRMGRFRFAALQSEVGGRLLGACRGAPPPRGESIVVVEADECRAGSDALLAILRRLPAPWPLLRALQIVPTPMRDWIYDGVARNRYRWFGRRDVCRVSLDGFEDRFLY